MVPFRQSKSQNSTNKSEYVIKEVVLDYRNNKQNNKLTFKKSCEYLTQIQNFQSKGIIYINISINIHDFNSTVDVFYELFIILSKYDINNVIILGVNEEAFNIICMHWFSEVRFDVFHEIINALFYIPYYDNLVMNSDSEIIHYYPKILFGNSFLKFTDINELIKANEGLFNTEHDISSIKIEQSTFDKLAIFFRDNKLLEFDTIIRNEGSNLSNSTSLFEIFAFSSLNRKIC